jgi:DNA adenine methylase
MARLAKIEVAKLSETPTRTAAAALAENLAAGEARQVYKRLDARAGHSAEGAAFTRWPLRDDEATKPFLKWAGGKARLLAEIRQRYPAGLGETVTKYAEPFVGGGAVLFDVLSRYDMEEVYISDVNQELIATYVALRERTEELIGALKRLENTSLSLDGENRENYYYANRDRFNSLKRDGVNSVELASLLIFLNKNCYNGLYRVNSRGAFNVPYGGYPKPVICDETNLLAVAKKLRGVKIKRADYKEALSFIDARSFVYFDPPYRPLSATANFTSYAAGGFGDREQEALAGFIDEISARGARFVASNSDPKNADANDDFFDRLYSRHRVERIFAGRAINSKGASRGKISELLISNA